MGSEHLITRHRLLACMQPQAQPHTYLGGRKAPRAPAPALRWAMPSALPRLTCTGEGVRGLSTSFGKRCWMVFHSVVLMCSSKPARIMRSLVRGGHCNHA